MGFFYILIGLFVLCFLFIFTKNNKDLAWLSVIPLLIMFFAGLIVLVAPTDDDIFIEKYELYKSIDIDNHQEPKVRYNITKEIISINESINYNKELLDNKFFSVFASDDIAELELIELRY